MDKFVIKKLRNLAECFVTSLVEVTPNVETNTHISSSSKSISTQKRSRDEFSSDDIAADPSLRKPIDEIDVAIRDRVRREYLLKGACQPIGHNFPKKEYGNEWSGFRAVWFKNNDWLEYSVAKDAVFCLYCYLFKQLGKSAKHRGDAFSKIDFSHWKRAIDAFKEHVGGVDSAHNYARRQVADFMNQR
ncbi:UNVERIFIED_CONTAM: hypothetical protein Sradi_2683300 [Sesamum radiatum]|uniref:TTF-type domain-containing protein n=1 Tax=Sesamum radiatum TaxID=300843 RepID=A0AAW2S669_SESRA